MFRRASYNMRNFGDHRMNRKQNNNRMAQERRP